MLRIEYHPDALANDFVLFCDDVRRIGSWRDLFAHGPPVSALTIKPSEGSLDSIVEASRSILFGRHSDSCSSRFWLFLTDDSWQDETRLANYWKIWKYLSRQGITWPVHQRGPEVVVRSPHGVRYATSALVNDANLREAMTIIFQHLGTAFMLMSADDLVSESAVTALFDNAFSGSADGYPETHLNWGRLIQSRAARGEVIIKRAGLIDEFAWSLDLFAQPHLLGPLMQTESMDGQ